MQRKKLLKFFKYAIKSQRETLTVKMCESYVDLEVGRVGGRERIVIFREKGHFLAFKGIILIFIALCMPCLL